MVRAGCGGGYVAVADPAFDFTCHFDAPCTGCCQHLMHDMEEAYRMDRKAYKDKKPGLHKLAMLEVGTCRSCWTTSVRIVLGGC